MSFAEILMTDILKKDIFSYNCDILLKRYGVVGDFFSEQWRLNCRKYLGPSFEWAFDFLARPARAPWLIETSDDVSEISYSRLSLERTAEAAYCALLYLVDNWRLYPDKILSTEDTVTLLKNGKTIIRAKRWSRNSGVPPRERFEKAVRKVYAEDASRIVKRLADLPGISRFPVELTGFSLGTGPLSHTPGEVAWAWQGFLAAYGVQIKVHEAQADMAWALGFTTWHHLIARWHSSEIHEPQVLTNHTENRAIVCGDLVDTLAAFDYECQRMAQDHPDAICFIDHSGSALQLSLNEGARKVAETQLSLEYLYDSRVGVPWESYGRTLVSTEAVSDGRWPSNYTVYAPAQLGESPREIAEALAVALSKGASTHEQLARSDERLGLGSAFMFRGYRLSACPSSGWNEALLRVEPLLSDGWIDRDSGKQFLPTTGHPYQWPWLNYMSDVKAELEGTTLNLAFYPHIPIPEKKIILASFPNWTVEENFKLRRLSKFPGNPVKRTRPEEVHPEAST
jgi:hypothetical protein